MRNFEFGLNNKLDKILRLIGLYFTIGGNNMIIKTIQIKEIHCFEHFSAYLNEKLTVIVGNNSSGKSTLLDAISIAVGTFFSVFCQWW